MVQLPDYPPRQPAASPAEQVLEEPDCAAHNHPEHCVLGQKLLPDLVPINNPVAPLLQDASVLVKPRSTSALFAARDGDDRCAATS